MPSGVSSLTSLPVWSAPERIALTISVLLMLFVGPAVLAARVDAAIDVLRRQYLPKCAVGAGPIQWDRMAVLAKHADKGARQVGQVHVSAGVRRNRKSP